MTGRQAPGGRRDERQDEQQGERGTATTEEARRRPRPRAVAVAVGLLLLVVVLLPAAAAALASWTSFTGCAIWCTPPQPAIGVAMAVVTLGILSLPLLAGWVVRRRRRPPMVWRVVGVALLVVGFCLALDAVGSR